MCEKDSNCGTGSCCSSSPSDSRSVTLVLRVRVPSKLPLTSRTADGVAQAIVTGLLRAGLIPERVVPLGAQNGCDGSENVNPTQAAPCCRTGRTSLCHEWRTKEPQ